MVISTGWAKYALGAVAVGGALAAASAARTRARRRALAGQLVLITGGSRGLGLALAREFCALGCRVAICARDGEELNQALEILSLEGGGVSTFLCDISNRDEVNTLVEAVEGQCGPIEILVNNAGEIMVSPLENLEVADFERAMQVMFWGPLYATLAVMPSMRERGRGRIVNITSIGGRVSVPHLLSYGCAKAACVALSNGLRSEVAQYGIEVTTIVPGLMRTGSHVNACFKGHRTAEASWFGVAASMPVLSLNAERAARLAIKAMIAGRSEAVLGKPAQVLAAASAIFPGFTADLLRFGNAVLPAGNDDPSEQTGLALEGEHGSLYRLLTTLGRRAGQRLNQPV